MLNAPPFSTPSSVSTSRWSIQGSSTGKGDTTSALLTIINVVSTRCSKSRILDSHGCGISTWVTFSQHATDGLTVLQTAYRVAYEFSRGTELGQYHWKIRENHRHAIAAHQRGLVSNLLSDVVTDDVINLAYGRRDGSFQHEPPLIS